MQISKTAYQPTAQGEIVSHLANDTLEVINLVDKKIIHSHALKHQPSCDPTCSENMVYGGDVEGNVFKYDMRSEKSEYLNTGEDPIIDLELLEDYLFAVSKNTIYQIRVS